MPPPDNPTEYCQACKEQVVRYPGEEGCPFCGGPTVEFGDLIDELRERYRGEETSSRVSPARRNPQYPR